MDLWSSSATHNKRLLIALPLETATLLEKLEYLFFSLGYFRAISWTYMTNISEKYSPLYVLLSFQKYFGFFRTSTFRDIHMTKDSEVHLKNCLLIHICSTSSYLSGLIGQEGMTFAHYTGDPWNKSREWSYFQYRYKTSEYSEIYPEQLTLKPFLPYNYRSSTLPGISRNIGWLLRQCSAVASWLIIFTCCF
jgi:hypothetical protein